MGLTTAYAYNELRQLTQVTDPKGHTTTYNYCGCGGPSDITDALGNVTVYFYNNAGWLDHVVYPSGGSGTVESYQYNKLGQITQKSDNLGYRTFDYNYQGLPTGTYNNFGQEQLIDYDIYDHPISVTDQNGVTATRTFDFLGRVRTNSYSATMKEYLGYSARGLTAYTNQLGKATYYGYDEAGRKTSETNANNEVIRYTYNSAGDLTNLLDGKSQQTTWVYDTEGRVTQKKDHRNTIVLSYHYDFNSRLTDRTTPAKGITYYAYDNAGNLTASFGVSS